MINPDFATLYNKMLMENLNEKDYLQIVNRLVDDSGGTKTPGEAFTDLINSKLSQITDYIITKITQESYDEIPSLTDTIQKNEMMRCEVYLVMSEMLKLKSSQIDDGYDSQEDDFVSLTKSKRGLKEITGYKIKADNIIYRYYCV